MLVTGASGFIGGRLVERLVTEHRASVRVLVRLLVRAAPLTRFPIEIRVGDVLNAGDVAAAIGDCDVVFHCAKGRSRIPKERQAVDVQGTRNVLEAAARAQVKRVIHVSTVMVYDIPPAGDLHEECARTHGGELYAQSKLAGERLAVAYARERGLPVTVIQPTVVYGPNAGVYGRDLIDELRSSRVPLVDHGAGACNAVFIDDLVTAMLLAATSELAPGEVFLVSGAEPVTWREFFGAFERMLGVRRTVAMSTEEALQHWRRSTRRSWMIPELARIFQEDATLRRRIFETREGVLVEKLAQRLLPSSIWHASDEWFRPRAPSSQGEHPIAAFRPDVVRFLESKARVRIDKARALLGYEPVFDLDAGMHLTEQWARWAGLLDDGVSPLA